MQLNRVVITGVGVVSPFGSDVNALIKGIEEGASAVQHMEGWDQYTDCGVMWPRLQNCATKNRYPGKRGAPWGA